MKNSLRTFGLGCLGAKNDTRVTRQLPLETGAIDSDLSCLLVLKFEREYWRCLAQSTIGVQET